MDYTIAAQGPRAITHATLEQRVPRCGLLADGTVPIERRPFMRTVRPIQMDLHVAALSLPRECTLSRPDCLIRKVGRARTQGQCQR
jgi:hypothetical protein